MTQQQIKSLAFDLAITMVHYKFCNGPKQEVIDIIQTFMDEIKRIEDERV